MTGHTKGPWTIVPANKHGRHGIYIEDEIGNTVCDLYFMKEQTGGRPRAAGHSNAEANALLIGAAPQLLSELKIAADELEASGLAHNHPSVVRIRAAIAAAEGVQS